MWALLRGLGLILVVFAGLWFGFAVPFIVFLLTGLPLPAVLAVAFASFVGGLVLNERRCPPGARRWLRGPSGSSACSALLQLVSVLAGGWSFGS